jgi:hypothetical protein
MGFKELCPGVLQNYVRTPNLLCYSQVIRTIFLEVGVNIFDFPIGQKHLWINDYKDCEGCKKKIHK